MLDEPNWRVCIAAALLALAGAAGQEAPIQTQGCPDDTDFEGLRYRIRSARIDDPWDALVWKRSGGSAAQAAAGLQGRPFVFTEVRRVQAQVEKERLLRYANDVEYSDILLANCSGGELDVVFRVFSLKIAPEFHSPLAMRPAFPLQSLRLMPLAGYDRTQRFFSGGSVEARWSAAPIPLDTLAVEGYGSTSGHQFMTALGGQHDSTTGWLAHADWRLEFQNSSLPTQQAPLQRARLALAFAAASHPRAGVSWRFGGMLEGGHERGAAAALAPQTIARTSYTGATLFTGVKGRAPRQDWSLSYGLALGSTGNTFHSGWRRHLTDAAHELWLPAGDHHQLEVEQRLSAGVLQVLRGVPLPERFFGGNAEQVLAAGVGWQIRTAPLIRSIPAQRFSLDGAGAGRFVAYNSTVSLTAWHHPLVPTELSAAPEFRGKLNGALESSTSVLHVAYAARDPHFREALDKLPALAAALEKLSASLPDSEDEVAAGCADAVEFSSGYVERARQSKPVRAYGTVAELLPDGAAALADIVSACDPLAHPAAAEVERLAAELASAFAAIDQKAAATRAAADMAYVRRTLDVIVDEINVASLSPVLVFDTAWIGPAGGTRYGIGGGFRLVLAGAVHFTGGYAWNPVRRPGEGAGAFFFSLATRDVFR